MGSPAVDSEFIEAEFPSQLGPEYNAHALESILKYVAPELGWR